MRAAAGPAIAALRLSEGGIQADLHLTATSDSGEVIARCRRLLDLDADPLTIDGRLAEDELLAPMVIAAPGRRSPGAVDGAEIVVRAVLGQQVSVQAARTVAGRLSERLGAAIVDPVGGLCRAFPSPSAIADAPDDLFPMPVARRETLRSVCRSLVAGDLVVDHGADASELRRRLRAHRGIGDWTASYVGMRALGDPDVFLPTDLGVRRALERAGAPTDPQSAAGLAERWRPWRSYALHHLWGSLP